MVFLYVKVKTYPPNKVGESISYSKLDIQFIGYSYLSYLIYNYKRRVKQCKLI